jgi:DnaJ-class molecular chaperone
MPTEKCEFCSGKGDMLAKVLAKCIVCKDGLYEYRTDTMSRCNDCKGTEKVIVKCRVPCKYCGGNGFVLV